MCGISAAISLSPKALDPSIAGGKQQNGNAIGASKLENSLEAIKHRGPDARDTWSSNDGRVGEFAGRTNRYHKALWLTLFHSIGSRALSHQ